MTSIIKHIPQDVGSSYYSKQADGTLIQWGTKVIPNGGYAATVQFPVNFINTSYAANITFIINDTTVHNVVANAKAKNYMSVNRAGNVGAHTFDWIAIGRWK